MNFRVEPGNLSDWINNKEVYFKHKNRVKNIYNVDTINQQYISKLSNTSLENIDSVYSIKQISNKYKFDHFKKEGLVRINQVNSKKKEIETRKNKYLFSDKEGFMKTMKKNLYSEMKHRKINESLIIESNIKLKQRMSGLSPFIDTKKLDTTFSLNKKSLQKMKHNNTLNKLSEQGEKMLILKKNREDEFAKSKINRSTLEVHSNSNNNSNPIKNNTITSNNFNTNDNENRFIRIKQNNTRSFHDKNKIINANNRKLSPIKNKKDEVDILWKFNKQKHMLNTSKIKNNI